MRKIAIALGITMVFFVFSCQKENKPSDVSSNSQTKSEISKVLIGHIEEGTVTLKASDDVCKSEFLRLKSLMAEAYNKGDMTFESYKISENPIDIKSGISYLTIQGKEKIGDELLNIAIAIPLTRVENDFFIGSKLKGTAAEIIELHKCTGHQCSSCSFDKDENGNVIGCKDSPPASCEGACRCDHTIEQVIVPE